MSGDSVNHAAVLLECQAAVTRKLAVELEQRALDLRTDAHALDLQAQRLMACLPAPACAEAEGQWPIRVN